MMVRRGGIQQLSCHAQSRSVPIPGGGKVIEELSLCVFSHVNPAAGPPRFTRNRMAQPSAVAVETAPAVSLFHSSSPPSSRPAESLFHAPRMPI